MNTDPQETTGRRLEGQFTALIQISLMLTISTEMDALFQDAPLFVANTPYANKQDRYVFPFLTSRDELLTHIVTVFSPKRSSVKVFMLLSGFLRQCSHLYQETSYPATFLKGLDTPSTKKRSPMNIMII